MGEMSAADPKPDAGAVAAPMPEDPLCSFDLFVGQRSFLFGVMDMAQQEKRDWAIAQLRQRWEATGEMPKKGDFDEITRARIKAFLGPWPRALEAAGVKAPKSPDSRISQPPCGAQTAGEQNEKET